MCKNKKFIQSITAIVMTIISAGVSADYDEKEYLKYQEEHILEVYCDEEVLKCLNLKYSSCKSNIKKGNVNCTSQKLLQAFDVEFEDIKKNSNEINEESARYAKCLTDNFREKLKISDSKFNKCEPLMVRVIEERRNREKEEYNLRNKNEY